MAALLASPRRQIGLPVYVIDTDTFLYWNGTEFRLFSDNVSTIDGGGASQQSFGIELDGGFPNSF